MTRALEFLGRPGRRPLVALVVLSVGHLVIGIRVAAAGDPAAGQRLYESKCGGCHSVDANRIGPAHRGVVGRSPGSVSGFDYSVAVRKLRGTWTPRRLDRWLQDPQRMAPGARMYFSVSDPSQRGDIIEYLKSVSLPADRH